MRLTVSSSASSRTVANITLEEKYGQSVLKKNKIRFYWNLKESHFFHCKDSVWKAGSIPRTWRYTWSAFVLCSDSFSSWYFGFPFSSKPNIAKFQFDLFSVEKSPICGDAIGILLNLEIVGMIGIRKTWNWNDRRGAYWVPWNAKQILAKLFSWFFSGCNCSSSVSLKTPPGGVYGNKGTWHQFHFEYKMSSFREFTWQVTSFQSQNCFEISYMTVWVRLFWAGYRLFRRSKNYTATQLNK